MFVADLQYHRVVGIVIRLGLARIAMVVQNLSEAAVGAHTIGRWWSMFARICVANYNFDANK